MGTREKVIMSNGIFRTFYLLLLLTFSVAQTAFAGWQMQICPRCRQPHVRVWVPDQGNPQSPSHQQNVNNGSYYQNTPRATAPAAAPQSNAVPWGNSKNLFVRNGLMAIKTGMHLADLQFNDRGCLSTGGPASDVSSLYQDNNEDRKNLVASYRNYLKREMPPQTRKNIENFLAREDKIKEWWDLQTQELEGHQSDIESSIRHLSSFVHLQSAIIKKGLPLFLQLVATIQAAYGENSEPLALEALLNPNKQKSDKLEQVFRSEAVVDATIKLVEAVPEASDSTDLYPFLGLVLTGSFGPTQLDLKLELEDVLPEIVGGVASAPTEKQVERAKKLLGKVAISAAEKYGERLRYARASRLHAKNVASSYKRLASCEMPAGEEKQMFDEWELRGRKYMQDRVKKRLE